MQWLINEFKQFKADVFAKVEAVEKNTGLEERITKLEGELKAMKARMGKQKDA